MMSFVGEVRQLTLLTSQRGVGEAIPILQMRKQRLWEAKELATM